LIAAFFLAVGAGGAPGYNNPSLKWRTIKTEHFEIHYHEGAEWTARQVAAVAEEVHGPICELYQFEPDLPVHFIIKDADDYANGAAYFYENKVELWATNLEFGYRGTTQWIRNVVTHEYTHIVSIQAAMKMGRSLPAVYFQFIGFEDEKRPDVLQGYPKDIVSYPISGLVYPPWFAEGVAQFATPGSTHDCWDTHRDMILRCAVLEDKMLTYDEMSFFGKSSMRGEQVYDHGFGLVNFIASRYGPESIREITNELRAPLRLGVDGALKKVTGKTGKQIYGDWKAHLVARYDEQAARARERGFEGREVVRAGEKDGFMNAWPVFSPDGKKIAYLSNRGSDYAGTDLYVMDRDGTNRRLVKSGVSSRPDFYPDGKRILYSRKHVVNRYGSTVNDLFVYDLEDNEEKRITNGARVSDPDLSPDGGTIVGVKNGDGTHRIVILDAGGRNERELYSSEMGTQFYNPSFSPDGERILFGIFRNGTRDIAVLSVDGAGFENLLATPSDERDASWTADGKGVAFSCDRTGIFDAYELDLETGRIARRTAVVGGAFNPDISEDGALVYSGYGGDGYGIRLVPAGASPVETTDVIAFSNRDIKPFDECQRLAREPARALVAGRPADGSGSVAFAAGADSSVAPPASSKYKSTYTSFQFFPRVTVWDGIARIGLNLASNEILDKQSLFGGGSYGTNGEFDAYIAYEIRNFYPTIFADFIVMRELYSEKGTFEQDGSVFLYDYDLTYDLWQADIGLRLELSELYSLTHQNQIAAYWSHGEYRVHIQGDEYRDGVYEVSPKGGWKYFIGNEAILDWTFRTVGRAVDSEINPRGGRRINVQYMRSFDRLFTSGEFEYGFRPIYENNGFNRYTVDWHEYVALPYSRHSLDLRFYGSLIDRSVDDFFWTYVGGRDGIRGYTYYSLGGKKAALASLTYRFPLWRNIDRQNLHLYFRDLYGGVFYETANAWSTKGLATEGYKNSVGLELRLSLGSYYLYPTAISWVSAYAIDPVENVLPGTLPVVIRQERGWSHYLTIGFTFGM
jgi:hypothetical protein